MSLASRASRPGQLQPQPHAMHRHQPPVPSLLRRSRASLRWLGHGPFGLSVLGVMPLLLILALVAVRWQPPGSAPPGALVGFGLLMFLVWSGFIALLTRVGLEDAAARLLPESARPFLVSAGAVLVLGWVLMCLLATSCHYDPLICVLGILGAMAAAAGTAWRLVDALRLGMTRSLGWLSLLTVTVVLINVPWVQSRLSALLIHPGSTLPVVLGLLSGAAVLHLGLSIRGSRLAESPAPVPGPAEADGIAERTIIAPPRTTIGPLPPWSGLLPPWHLVQHCADHWCSRRSWRLLLTLIATIALVTCLSRWTGMASGIQLLITLPPLVLFERSTQLGLAARSQAMRPWTRRQLACLLHLLILGDVLALLLVALVGVGIGVLLAHAPIPRHRLGADLEIVLCAAPGLCAILVALHAWLASKTGLSQVLGSGVMLAAMLLLVMDALQHLAAQAPLAPAILLLGGGVLGVIGLGCCALSLRCWTRLELE